VRKAYGLAHIEHGVPNTTDTRFKLMSVSKSITAIARMRLVPREVVSLKDPIYDPASIERVLRAKGLPHCAPKVAATQFVAPTRLPDH